MTDDDGTRHRLWVIESTGRHATEVADLLELAGAGPITIADGHHRYETALRYRDERRMSRSCEEDPAFDYLLMLFLEADPGSLTVLPTHRIIRDVGDAGLAELGDRLGELFAVSPATADELRAAFGAGGRAPGGRGRFGLWTRAGGQLLSARRAAFAAFLPAGGEALRGLDVVLLGTALERLFEIDAATVASGGRIGFSKSVDEALAAVDHRTDGADAAFLLEPTPVASIAAVAAEGDVMPQKSTYFFPKALTGLVINPHEW